MKLTFEAFTARAMALGARQDNSAHLTNFLATMIDSLSKISQVPSLDSAQKLNLFAMGFRDRIGPPLSAEEYDLVASIFGMEGFDLMLSVTPADSTLLGSLAHLSAREAALARGYFQRGLEQGRLQGALEDRTRRNAKVARSKQSSARKHKGIWAPFKPKLQEIVRGYAQDKARSVVGATQANVLSSIKGVTGSAPAASTLSEWIANYRSTGDIFDNSLRVLDGKGRKSRTG